MNPRCLALHARTTTDFEISLLSPNGVSVSASPCAGGTPSSDTGGGRLVRIGVAAGITGSLGRASGDDDYHFGFDVAATCVFSPTAGFGLLLGPSLEVPLKGKTEVADKRAEYRVFSLGLTGGLVVRL